MVTNSFRDALAHRQPLIVDGGLATQLETQGADISGVLWSASLLRSDPRAIVDASLAFLHAGADCIATASYQASREGFRTLGVSDDEADDLMLFSVELARRAREEFLAVSGDAEVSPLIAASIGPYGAILHDGSEYRGDYAIGVSALRAFHDQRLRVFDRAGADVLAVETIPSLDEARILAELLRACDTPAWVSFSCRDGQRISDGTPIEQAIGVFAGHPAVLAVGVNCTAPRHVTELVGRIRASLPDKWVIAYPNSGETYDAGRGCWLGTVEPVDCAAAAVEWVDAGASIIGGCCRMGPEHIAAMRNAFSR